MVERIPTPETVPVALAIVEGPSLILEWCNEYVYQMAAMFTDQEIVGHPIGEFLPISNIPEIELAINNCADTGEPSHLTGEIVGPAGVMSIYASIYRVPGDRLLITAWHPVPEPIGQSTEPIGTIHAQARDEDEVGDEAE
jgi:hypothetical protein